MNIYRSQLSPQAIHVQLPTQSPASVTVIKSEDSASPTPLISDASVLNKVSDPKFEMKKEFTSPNGLFGVKYSLAAPSPGLSNITFPIIIDEGLQKADKDAGIYYAMMFGVNTEKGTALGRGYIGMQPRGDGKALIIFPDMARISMRPKGVLNLMG